MNNKPECVPYLIEHDANIHLKDPFDRLLVAQARAEAMTLISRDPEIRRSGDPEIAEYDVDVLVC